ncbi:MAG TPA: hypothetical protein VFL14_10140 [Xanthomonadales bacterium]|nr:hypothetical protein [Xanthomonadales bacterium]
MTMRHPSLAAAIVALAAAMPARALNNCSTFSDLRGRALVVVNTIGFRYSPACAQVSSGTTVRFVSEFGTHPLYGGLVAGGIATIDPASPLGPFVQGSQAEVLLVAEGELPYFCDFHWNMGMQGSIRVVPELFVDSFE